jgi:hypothetical protein
MRRRWRGLALVIGVLVVGGVVLAVVASPRFQKWYNPPVLAVPGDEEVIEIRASLRGVAQLGVPETPEFVVPADRVPLVMWWLRPAEDDSHPPLFPDPDELGKVCIRTRDGRELRLRFFEAGKGPVVFTADGIDFFLGAIRQSESGDWLAGSMGLAYDIRDAADASRR